MKYVSLLMIISLAGLPGCSSDNHDGDTEDIHPDADPDASVDAGNSAPGIDSGITGSGTDKYGFTIDITSSPTIATVGILTWSLEHAPIDNAHVEFGPDMNYGLSAPVDLSGPPPYRTLLLGMKPDAEYHLRVVAQDGDDPLRSTDRVVRTGPLLNGLPAIQTDTPNPGSRAGGYTITAMMDQSVALVLDGDGDIVWWYQASRVDPAPPQINRARMSYDGLHMLMGAHNLTNDGSGVILKVSMDGIEKEVIDTPSRHHDFTVLPEEGLIAYLEYDREGAGVCDRIVERAPDGTTRVVYAIRTDFSHLANETEWCHANAIDYVVAEDAYYITVLKLGMILKIDRAEGVLVWTFGGTESDFIGKGWGMYHQFHVLDDGLLIFNNGSLVGTAGSSAVEYGLDEINRTATWRWEYYGSETSLQLGDVQRLGNGNTLVTFSTAGTIHEVDLAGKMIQKFTISTGGAFGYTIRRDSLYGPPPQ